MFHPDGVINVTSTVFGRFFGSKIISSFSLFWLRHVRQGNCPAVSLASGSWSENNFSDSTRFPQNNTWLMCLLTDKSHTSQLNISEQQVNVTDTQIISELTDLIAEILSDCDRPNGYQLTP
ncbi:hypothetical protein DPMN_187954 [Dreissena polymorpha]|uniref:Uncharacterized protein n=1 Tax=Dreissena polymorpha TaxID=45954 RepID=A0A9D4DT09_DREPO|nr:hypothetical protein DPMN_187954 [Dreissena polymorpha]